MRRGRLIVLCAVAALGVWTPAAHAARVDRIETDVCGNRVTQLPRTLPGGTDLNQLPLDVNCPVNGNWCPWDPPCSEPCGGGEWTRRCECPAPAFGGTGCTGPDREPCNTQSCTCVYSAWADVGCTQGGCAGSTPMQQTRTARQRGCAAEFQCVADTTGACGCVYSAWSDVGCTQGGCFGSTPMRQTRTSTQSGCAAEFQCVASSSCGGGCVYGGWSDVGCDQGGCAGASPMRQTRTSTQSGCAAEFQCVASASCCRPVDGGWSGWSAWSAWSACSGGTQSRSRTQTCTNPSPSCTGAACPSCTGAACPTTNTETESRSCCSSGPANPIGWLDVADCSIIGGWTFDPDSPNCSISVHVYIDSAFWSASVTTGFRSDVNAVYGISGNHGYTFTTPASIKDGKNHSVVAYGINDSGAGPNPSLSGTPKTVNCGGAPSCPPCATCPCCGDGYCSPFEGETLATCPQDCCVGNQGQCSSNNDCCGVVCYQGTCNQSCWPSGAIRENAQSCCGDPAPVNAVCP